MYMLRGILDRVLPRGVGTLAGANLASQLIMVVALPPSVYESIETGRTVKLRFNPIHCRLGIGS